MGALGLGSCCKGARAIGVLLVLAAVSFFAAGARAQGLEYSSIDRATVRILALGAADTMEFEEEDVRFVLATPMGGHGSGFVVSADGLIVTAAHVVAGARSVAVHAMGLMGPLPARVVHVDEMRDIALLRVSHQFSEVAQLADPGVQLKVREEVYAIGFPLDATRADPQSSRGVVSGRLPDGRLQLSISLNPGNSGGPVIGPSDRVFGVVSARADPKAGAEGLAAAVPLDAFRERVTSEMAAPTTVAPFSAIDQKLADLVSLIAHEGDRLVRGSVDVKSDEAARTERQVRQLLKEMPQSADAALLGGAFFWNRHVADRVHDKDATGSKKNAVHLVQRAVKLDPTLQQQSAFVRHVLAAREGIEPNRAVAGGRVRGKVASSGSTVAFTSPDEGITLHVKLAEGASEVGGRNVTAKIYGSVCKAPCESDLDDGYYELALSKDGESPVPVAESVNVDGPTTIEGKYHDRTGIRAAGWVIAFGGSLLGTWYSLKPEEQCDDFDSSGDSEPYCYDTYPHVIPGMLVIGGSVLAGILMIRVKDKTEVSLTPGVAGLSPRQLVGLEMDQLRGLTVEGRF